MGNLPSPQSLYHRAESLTLRQNIPDIPTYGSMSLPGSRDTVARSDYPHGLLGWSRIGPELSLQLQQFAQGLKTRIGRFA